jgi:hypothetical protein
MLPNQLYLTSRTLLNRMHPTLKYHMYHHDLVHHMGAITFFLSGINFDPQSNAPLQELML